MKVIFVIVSLAGGGAERVISILANRFVEEGIDVTIMMTAGDAVAYRLDQRVHLVSMGGTSGGSLRLRLQRLARMRAYFGANQDAVIISFGPGTSFFAVAASLFQGHRMLISERNDPAICPHKRLRNLVYGRAQQLVFQTEQARNCFPVRLRRKGRIIPNPIASGLSPVYLGERKKTVAAVGRLEAQKNHRLLLEAFALFHQKYSDWKLEIYGEGSLRQELETLAKELSLSQAVSFPGFVTEVTEKIKDAGMYVLSSDYEGISNSLLEAMSLGIPSISTDCPIGGSSLCIRSGDNGLLVPVGDRMALAEAMEKLAGNSKLAKQMGQRGAELRECWSEKNIGRQWLECIREIQKG